MTVKCTKNELKDIVDEEVHRRLEQSIHLDGPMNDLFIGCEYVVQALEQWKDGGLWLYLHTAPESSYPYPYPAEMFEFVDNTLPAGWSIRLQTDRGNVICKRITFSAWADDEHFYEKLVDGDAEIASVYSQKMISP